MKKCLVAMTILALVILAAGCAGVPSSTPTAPIPAPALTPTGEEVNFRLLISDEPNAIGEFQSLNVTISSIGMHRAGEEDGWIELDPEVEPVDLTLLQGDNATAIWSGNITAGDYNKVFIYVDNVTGVLNGGGAANVKLPPEKLQISKPFTVNETGEVNFVYDITVVKAGKSGKYILKPQIAQSGADQPFNEVPQKGKNGQAGKSNVAFLYLREKDPSTWEIVDGGAWGKLKYSLAGPTFNYVFNGHGLEANTDYSLIYYADKPDRFEDWGGDNPGALIASGTSNDERDIHLMGSVELDMDLPCPPDANIDEYDYSEPPDNYQHAHGAKIWLVPSRDYDEGNENKVTGWEPSAFLFETDLITYDDTDTE